MPITKIQLHGVADSAGALEQDFRRLGRGMTQFIADKTPVPGVEENFTERDDDGNIVYAMTGLKFTPVLYPVTENGVIDDYVVGHATFTIWHG